MVIQTTLDINFNKKQAILLAFILLASIVSACSAAPTAVGAVGTPVSGTPEVSSDCTSPTGEAAQGADNLGAAVASRTPLPTSVPGQIDERIGNFATETGLAGKSFLGLTAEDWINLAISACILLVGYTIGIRLLTSGLKWLLHKRSKETDDSDTDDFLVDDIKRELRVLVMLVVGRFAIFRLDFLSVGLRTLLDDIIFIVGLIALLIIALRSLSFFFTKYQTDLSSQEDRKRLNPIIQTVHRLSEIIVLVFFGSIGLSHFGFSVNALAASLLVIGLIIALGAQDNIADIMNGFIILLDQPFRVGDRIWIKELDTTGDIINIGTRTTLIRTGDSRDVVIPNSQLGQSQVVNYSYPDPSYRVQTDLGVAYGSDMGQARKVIEDTVRGVEGPLPDKPVQVFFREFGDASRTVRVRWWIENYGKRHTVRDKVNTALELELEKAGIGMPNPTYDQNIKIDSSLIKELKGNGDKNDD